MKPTLINFESIDEHGPQSFRETFVFTADELDRDEVAGGGEAVIDVTVSAGDAEADYVAEGTVGFTADLNCARCAEPYPFANSSAFHVVFRPRPEASEENEEVEITSSGELDVEFYSERNVPLRELALEQVQLSIPMKPLCDENCLGLCPHCGVNRSRETCSCAGGSQDERWSALREIREGLSKKNDN